MARSVVPLRLSDAEKAQIERAAKKQRITLSEFLRRAALTLSFRIDAAGKLEIKPAVEDEPSALLDARRLTRRERDAIPAPVKERRPEPHVVTAYSSFEQYAASSPYFPGGNALPPGGFLRDVE